MLRTILLCRHAETLDAYLLQPDFERELTLRGNQQAQQTGQWIREKFQKVDMLLASPARRASATARIIAARLYVEEDHISYNPELYNAREAQLLQCLASLPANINTVLLVAHNPGITRLARDLSNEHISYMEPAAVMVISLKLDAWQDIYTTTGVLQNSTVKNPG